MKEGENFGNTHAFTGITNLGGEIRLSGSAAEGQSLVGRGIFIDGKEAGPGTKGWRDSTPTERALGAHVESLGASISKNVREGNVRITNLEGGIVNFGDNTYDQVVAGKGAEVFDFTSKDGGGKSNERSWHETDPTFETYQWGDSTATPKDL